MKEKVLSILKVVLERIKSPVVWGGMIAIVGLIGTTTGYSLEDVATWQGLWGVIVAIFASPKNLMLIIVALFGFLNNPTDKANF